LGYLDEEVAISSLPPYILSRLIKCIHFYNTSKPIILVSATLTAIFQPKTARYTDLGEVDKHRGRDSRENRPG
jgi:hypothetical protein